MAISMECPSCLYSFSLPDDMAGKKSKCPECQFSLFVPHADAEPDAGSVTAAPSVFEAKTRLTTPAQEEPAEVMAVTSAPVKKKRAAIRKPASTSGPLDKDNPFEFQGEGGSGSPRRRRGRGWGVVLFGCFALFALIGVLGGGGAVAGYFYWSRAAKLEHAQLAATETTQIAAPPAETKRNDVKETPKSPKVDPVRKPESNPIEKPPVPMPGGNPSLLLAPIPQQTAKAGEQAQFKINVNRLECTGPVRIDIASPHPGLQAPPFFTLPASLDAAPISVVVAPTTPAGVHRLRFTVTLGKLSDSKDAELTVLPSANPVAVAPPTPPDPVKPPNPVTPPPPAPTGDVEIRGHSYQAATGTVESVALSPDQKTAVTGGSDGSLRHWDLTKLDTIAVKMLFQNANKAAITATAFSPDGKWVAFGDAEGSVRVTNLAGTEAFLLKPEKVAADLLKNPQRINAVQFSPQSELLAAAGSVYFGCWDLASKKQLAVGLDDYSAAAFTPDGQAVIAAGAKFFALIDPRADKPVQFLGDTSKSFDFYAAKQEIIAVRQQDQKAELVHLNMKTAEPRRIVEFKDLNEAPVRVVVADKPGFAVTGDKQGIVRGWDLQMNKEYFRVTPGHKGEVRALAVSGDGHRILSGGVDGTFRVIDLPNVK